MAVKGKKCGRMSVPVCRNKKGRFTSQGKGTTKKSTKRRKRRVAKGAVCKPGKIWKKRGVCFCRTKGGGVRTVGSNRTSARCRRVRRYKAPKK